MSRSASSAPALHRRPAVRALRSLLAVLLFAFERGSALIVTNSNNVTVDMRCSEEEKDLITTDRDELRRIVERKMQNQTETEES